MLIYIDPHSSVLTVLQCRLPLLGIPNVCVFHFSACVVWSLLLGSRGQSSGVYVTGVDCVHGTEELSYEIPHGPHQGTVSITTVSNRVYWLTAGRRPSLSHYLHKTTTSLYTADNAIEPI